MAVYRTNFRLLEKVNDLSAARAYLTEYDMTEYLPDNLKGIVIKVRWELTLADEGYVEAITIRDLTPEESADLSDWVSGQNSDGLGEGFEQQEFAEAYDDPDDWASYSMASFDWKTNKYKFNKIG